LRREEIAMAIKIRTQEPFRKFLDNEPEVELAAGSISELLKALKLRYPNFAGRLLDDTGAIRGFVNVYVNEEDIRFLQNQQTPLKDGDEISIIPATAGG
jgi:molybdopterin synthase sulfur carrier subunit